MRTEFASITIKATSQRPSDSVEMRFIQPSCNRLLTFLNLAKQMFPFPARIANLRKLGAKVDDDASRKGPSTMSCSRAVHEALSLDYLTKDGLANLLTIWLKLTAKNLNRPVRARARQAVWERLSRKADSNPECCCPTILSQASECIVALA